MLVPACAKRGTLCSPARRQKCDDMNAPSIPQAETIAPLPPPDAADADLELAFEAITTLAAQLSAAPIAFISVLDGHDQW